MKIRSAELETVCGITSRLPDNHRPEVAFAGKSNVGKSSLINALLGRKSLARVSSKPGKTQTINFYHLNRGVTEEETGEGFLPDLYLVDLPGYGYANVPESEKKKWGPMIERYLRGSGQLCKVFLLLDIRHAPSANDVKMYEWITANGFEPVIIATKKDKISRGQTAKQVRLLKDTLHMGKEGKVFPFSALTKEGLEEIQTYICGCVRGEEA